MNNPSSMQNTLSSIRILLFAVVLLLVFLVYTGRLFILQVIEGETWVAQAEENRTQILNLPAQRGIIYDRNGFVLASNVASYNVVIIPADLPGVYGDNIVLSQEDFSVSSVDDPSEMQEIFRQLSEIIDVPVNRSELSDTSPYVPCTSDHGIAQIAYYGYTFSPYEPVKVKCDVSREVAQIILEKSVDWPGVDIQVVPIREYQTGSLTASIIGYLGPISEQNEDYYSQLSFVANRDKVGYAGVEWLYQDILAGRNGLRTVERDVGGKALRDLIEPIPTLPGNNVRLTLDTRLQQAAEAILVDEINWWNDFFWDQPGRQMTSGVVIAMNPQTGEILAMVSYPSYENNRLARMIPYYYYEQLTADMRKPLLNHAVGDEIPAGSVFKLTTAVGALNEGVITPEKILDAPGKIVLEERPVPGAIPKFQEFPDWNVDSGGFGEIDFVHAIANSSNVYFYKVGGGWKDEVPEGLGICRLGAYARALGYGDYPGTGLPEEADGLVPDPEYKRRSGGESWTLGDTYIVSVGQGFILATPLQVLMSAATIANDGKLMNPTLLREVLDGEGNVIQPFEPSMRWDLTVDPVVEEFEVEPGLQGCIPTGEYKTVEPWVFEKIQQGMRMAVTEGTLSEDYVGFQGWNIAVAGKTGTAEYCDEFAKVYSPCNPGAWPTHAWTVAYGPYDNPEIAVVAFIYNGGEGARSAGPVVRRTIQAYFEIKAIDNALISP